MKKFEAVVLLVVFVFNSIGPFLKFELQRFKLWREVQELISTHPTKDLYTVTVTAENAHLIHWKHQREFTYRGLMFDVVSKKKLASGVVIYSCIADHKETSLYTELDKFVKKGAMPMRHSKASFAHPFQLFPSEPFIAWLPKTTKAIFFDKKRSWDFLFHYTSPSLAQHRPPPELIPVFSM
jgi:hypothetical protein